MALQVRRICATVTSFLITWYIYSLYVVHGPSNVAAPGYTSYDDSSAINTTLGFGAILVLATAQDTWRVQGLRKAAESLGISLSIPTIEPPDEVLVNASPIDTDDPNSVLDSYRASLSHVALLQRFLDLNVETALILEDDVDFGINIKEQMAAFSDALWSSAGSEASHHHGDPYDMASWDILWLGHCGLELVANTQMTYYRDPYALGWDRLTGCLNDWYDQQQRHGTPQTVLRGAAPIGSYAYGVHRRRAMSLVEENSNRTGRAFDFTLRIVKGFITAVQPQSPNYFTIIRLLEKNPSEAKETLLSKTSHGTSANTPGHITLSGVRDATPWATECLSMVDGNVRLPEPGDWIF
ncbi:hypothetical protein KC338_g9318 [Hortaea werneckii]|nr:hypothetical protein KC338_g9318 [Hortaea werneckii]